MASLCPIQGRKKELYSSNVVKTFMTLFLCVWLLSRTFYSYSFRFTFCLYCQPLRGVNLTKKWGPIPSPLPFPCPSPPLFSPAFSFFSPLYAAPPLFAPFLSSPPPSLPILLPSPNEAMGLGNAVSSPSGVRAEPCYFAAILSPENVFGGRDFCCVLWRTKCTDMLKLGLC